METLSRWGKVIGKCKQPEDGPNAAFWRAALALYARPGAQTALLDLQDRHGGDVMAALWALAAASAGRRIDAAAMAGFARATAAARAEAARLRAARRAAKAGAPEAYEAAKTLELAAERAVAAAAPAPATAGSPDSGDAATRARRNLAEAVRDLDPPPGPALLEALAGLAVD